MNDRADGPAGGPAGVPGGVPRRRFLTLGGTLAVGALLGRPAAANLAGWPAAPAATTRPPLDLLLRGGSVIDGTGRQAFIADIGVRDGRIVAVEPLAEATARLTLDVSGLVVAPGFIDIHGHTDLGILVDNRADSKIRQGVTTEAVGQDGSSVLPVDDRMRTERREHYRERYGVEIDIRGWEELFTRLRDTGMLANFVTMVGSGTVREAVVGEANRPAGEREMAVMIRHIEEALQAGAAGVSSGLEYTPNAYSSTSELVALARPMAGARLAYATHMRNEADTVLEALAEAIAVAQGAAVPLQVSHLKTQGRRNWPKAERLLADIERAAETTPVHFDRYPYTAYSTGLDSLFPAWSKDGGTDAFLERLGDPAEEVRLREAVGEKIAMMGDWDTIQIATAPGDAFEDAPGRRLGTYATEKGLEPYAAAVAILIATESRSQIVGHGMSEENTRIFVSHPRGAICSDASARRPEGPLGEGTPHPRAYGAFPRVLGMYVREERALPLEEAVRKMTSLPASILGLTDRGTVAAEQAADLVVFDPATVVDTATFERPHSYPIGIPHVVVNGRLAVQDGQPTGSLAGRILGG